MRKIHIEKLILLCLCLFFGYNIVFARSSHSVLSDNPLINVNQLKEMIKEGNVKLIDATSSMRGDLPDWKTYQTQYYGKFDHLMQQFAEEEYFKEHIPGAISLSLDVGFYVGEFKRYALYPASIFERYLRKLGINNDDHLVVYARGPFSGMLFAAHVWWLLKHYGVENVQVLNGGFEAWKRAGNPVEKGQVVSKEGNFRAVMNSKVAITFEDLEARHPDKISMIEHLNAINFFDGRPQKQYTGQESMHYVSSGNLLGSHIKGAKNLPAIELVNENGVKPPHEIWRLLDRAGYISGKPVITYCSVGNQGSLLALALTSLGINDVKLYQGGMTEMALRDPERIA